MKNRRYSYVEEEGSGLDLLRRMGMPFLYIVGVLTAISGMICMGLITHYWSMLTTPRCFLYSHVSYFNLISKINSIIYFVV